MTASPDHRNSIAKECAVNSFSALASAHSILINIAESALITRTICSADEIEELISMIAVEENISIRGLNFLRRTRALLPILLLVGGAVLHFNVASAAPPKEVLSEADLPRWTYPVTGAVSGLLEADDATFSPFLQKAAADIQSLLTDYSIKDRATLISVMSAKLATQELSGETADALKTIATLRDLQ
jgi:uncharacterized protein with beta-barrel porin domain